MYCRTLHYHLAKRSATSNIVQCSVMAENRSRSCEANLGLEQLGEISSTACMTVPYVYDACTIVHELLQLIQSGVLRNMKIQDTTIRFRLWHILPSTMPSNISNDWSSKK